jgi:hypothetical protein
MITKVQSTEYKVQSNNIESLEDIEKLPLAERVRWLGQCYARGATAYKEDEKVKEDIKSLNAQIFKAAQTMWKRVLRRLPSVQASGSSQSQNLFHSRFFSLPLPQMMSPVPEY